MIDIIFFFICCIGSSLVFAMGFFLGRRPAKAKPNATEVRKLVLTSAQTLDAAKLYDAATRGAEYKHYNTVKLWQYLCEQLPEHVRNEVMELNTTDCHRRWSIRVTLPVGFPTEDEWKAKKVAEAAAAKPLIADPPAVATTVPPNETGPDAPKA